MFVGECVSVSVCLSYSGNKMVYLPVFKLQGTDHLHWGCVYTCVCVCLVCSGCLCVTFCV